MAVVFYLTRLSQPTVKSRFFSELFGSEGRFLEKGLPYIEGGGACGIRSPLAVIRGGAWAGRVSLS